MRIAVCIKQVPVVSALQFDAQTRTLKRDGVTNEVSAFDVRALTKAVELKAAHGGDVTVVTMGPPQAREALEYCLALGADRALHLCDRAFAGADTLATARTLALCLRRESFDLILCGRNSVDAETGQVGPELAQILDLPQVTGARTLDISGRELCAERETDEGFELVATALPALVTAAEDLGPERFPSKADRQNAKTKPCVEIRAAELSADVSQFGATGSPTYVAALQAVEATRLGRVLEAASVDAAAAELSRILVDDYGLFGTWKTPEQPQMAALGPIRERHGSRDVWVLAEELDGEIRPVVLELLGRAAALARTLGGSVAAVLLGGRLQRHAATLAAHGADRVLLAEDVALTPYNVETHTAALVTAIRSLQPGIILVPATAVGRDLAPRVAARLGVGLTGDCVDVGLDPDGHLLQYKPALGGSIVAPILSRTIPEMATVRPGILARPAPDPSRPVMVEALSTGPLPSPRVRVTEVRRTAVAAAEMDEAEVVIGVGKGFGSKEHLAAVEPLRALLNAALATTRDVTDAGWLPKQYQIGLTGRAIAPNLYIAVAIRGAFEHTIGVRRAGLVVAINKNPKAPIFKAADYGVVGDYADVLPSLHTALLRARERRQQIG